MAAQRPCADPTCYAPTKVADLDDQGLCPSCVDNVIRTRPEDIDGTLERYDVV